MRMENKNLNIPNVTVEDVVNMFTMLYANALKANIPFKSLPTPFLWGPPGVGKSQGVHQLAKMLEEATGKTVAVTDVRLLLFTPVDLMGMPFADVKTGLCKWLRPAIFNMDSSDDCINLLFLDELSAAPQSVQAAAYQICLDRKVGEHKFPDNCIVIGAGNRTTDQSVSYKMPKALCNRLMHFNVQTNFRAWLDWAVASDIDSRVIGYLAFDNSKLCAEVEASDIAYPTPRSWEFVSNILKSTDRDIDDAGVQALIRGCVGVYTAYEFSAWVRSYGDMPKVEDVLSGRAASYPKTQDALAAFIASLATAIRQQAHKITAGELENACRYVNKIPRDFAMVFYNDLNRIEELKLKLMKCPASGEWYKKNKR